MTLDRRQFVTALLASAAAPAPTIDLNLPSFSPATSLSNPPDTKVDFRYAPHHQQSTICFPDDASKDHRWPSWRLAIRIRQVALDPAWENFATVVEFSLVGFQDDKILRQWIESPAVPIVHTLIDLPAATIELIAFTAYEPEAYVAAWRRIADSRWRITTE